MRVLTHNRAHLKLLCHVERVVDGDALRLFFLHVYDQMLTVDGISSGVFNENLMASNRGVAGVHKHIFIIFFLVFLCLARVGGVVEETEVRGVVLVEGLSDRQSPIGMPSGVKILFHLFLRISCPDLVNQSVEFALLDQVLLLLAVLLQYFLERLLLHENCPLNWPQPYSFETRETSA